MDVGNKTLSQLSDEAKEKRYVSLDTGAKVSGYTKEYLERLCRLNKVEYRFWNDGRYVIELESLLRETHTILLSYDDIVFVDKSYLAEPTEDIAIGVMTTNVSPLSVFEHAAVASEEATQMISLKEVQGITQSIPHFGETDGLIERKNNPSAFSFVGRAVVSDPLNPIEKIENLKHSTIEPIREVAVPAIPIANEPINQNAAHPLILGNTKVGVVADKKQSTPVPHGFVHLNIEREVEVVAADVDTELHSALDSAEMKQSESIPSPVIMTPSISPSMLARTLDFHPIQTSVDARMHHDDSPLFPQLEKTSLPAPSLHTDAIETHVAEELQHLAMPNLSTATRVIVYDPVPPNDRTIITPSLPIAAGLLATPSSGAEMNSDAKVSSPQQKIDSQVALTQSFTPPSEHPLERVVSALPKTKQFILPAIETERHLALRDNFSLVRSSTFNTAFVACLLLSLFALGIQFRNTIVGNPMTYIAAVVGVLPDEEIAPREVVGNGESAPTRGTVPSVIDQVSALPFSDIVRTATGTTEDVVLVAPVFGDTEGTPVVYVASDVSGVATGKRLK